MIDLMLTDKGEAATGGPLATVERVAEALATSLLSFANEDDLQYAISLALIAKDLPVDREVILHAEDGTPVGRIDLLCGRVGIEVKVAGRAPNVLRQLRRYADAVEVDHLLLVTTSASHRQIHLTGLTVVPVGRL